MLSLQFSRADDGDPDASEIETLCHPSNPFAGRTDSRAVQGPPDPWPEGQGAGGLTDVKKKRELFPGPPAAS